MVHSLCLQNDIKQLFGCRQISGLGNESQIRHNSSQPSTGLMASVPFTSPAVSSANTIARPLHIHRSSGFKGGGLSLCATYRKYMTYFQKCRSIWQWRIQGPGLSVRNLDETNPQFIILVIAKSERNVPNRRKVWCQSTRRNDVTYNRIHWNGN